MRLLSSDHDFADFLARMNPFTLQDKFRPLPRPYLLAEAYQEETDRLLSEMQKRAEARRLSALERRDAKYRFTDAQLRIAQRVLEQQDARVGKEAG